MEQISENMAGQIFSKAIATGRAAELLQVLTGGGSVTLEPDGELAVMTRQQIHEMNRPKMCDRDHYRGVACPNKLCAWNI